MEDRAHAEPFPALFCRALYEQSRDIIVSLLPDGTIHAVNPRGAEMLGETEGALRGQPVGVLFSEGCAPAVAGLLRAGYVGDSDGVVVLHGGQRATLSVFRSDDGGGTLLVLHDITHAHHLQRTISGINRIAAELAADIATPLAIIEGQIALLLAQPDISAVALREQLQQLRCHSQRIGHTVRDLQSVAAPGAARRGLTRLGTALDEALEEVGRRRRRVHIEHTLAPPDIRVYADPVQLRQILRNLICCAIDRSPAGRTVRILGREDGERAWVQVEDEGAPYTDELLSAINEVTHSQPPIPVLGLALTSAWKLAHRNGGGLQVQRRIGRGGVAVLELSQRLVGPAQEARHLLVVDRERLLHETVSWMLSEDDITVTSVTSMDAAAGLCARQRFDAVLVTPPSAALVTMLRVQQPEQASRVIQVGEGQLQTPFTRQELLAALGELS